MSRMGLEDLPPAYRLSWAIGEVVRQDVYAEHEMRVLWGALHGAGLGEGEKMPRSYGRLIPQVQSMLEEAEVPAEFGAMALPVIEDTAGAHRYRNEVAHDLLIEVPWGPDDARSAFGAYPPRPLTEIESVSAGLKTLTWRLRAVRIIAPQWVGGPVESGATEQNYWSWTRVALGHIADNPDRIEGTEGPAPEPPGGYRIPSDIDNLFED